MRRIERNERWAPTSGRLWISMVVALFAVACAQEEPPTAEPDEPTSDTTVWASDGTAPDTPRFSPETTTGPEETLEDVEAPLERWEGVDDGYVKGGLLATFINKKVDSISEISTDEPVTHLQTVLEMTTEEDSHFASYTAKGTLSAYLTGAIRVPQDGIYRLAISAADSAEVTLDGFTVFSFWDMGDVNSVETKLHLAQGWHPIDIKYQRGDFKSSLILYMAAEGELMEPLGPDRLGYPSTPPANAPELNGSATSAYTWSHGTRIEFESTVPARLTAIGTVEENEVTVTSKGTAGLTGDLVVPLAPNDSFSLNLEMVDIWDRTVSFEPMEVTTPEPPDYVFGGLIGSYYVNDPELPDEGPVAVRLDSQINFPTLSQTDGMGAWETNLPADNWRVAWEGAVWIIEPGEYTFYLGTNDGGRLTLNEELVIDNWLDHTFLSFEGYTVELHTGWHQLSVEMYESIESAEARLDWEGPGFSRSLVPPHHLASLRPSEDGLPPEVTSFEVTGGGAGDGSLTVTFTANELSTATVLINTADNVQHVQKFNAFSTGFFRVIGGNDSGEELQCGIATVQVKLTDLTGKKGYTDAKPVLVPGDDCEDDG